MANEIAGTAKEIAFPGTSLFSLHEIEKVLSLQTANQKMAAHKRKIRRKIEQRCQPDSAVPPRSIGIGAGRITYEFSQSMAPEPMKFSKIHVTCAA